MVANANFLQARVDEILSTQFDQIAGTVVPDTENVKLKDGAKKIDAAFLYADLAGSAKLSRACPWTTTATIIRAFLDCSTRLIVKHGGHVRSFDGDRVMGVFIGDAKNSNSSICAREIHWTVRKIIHPKAHKKFKSIRDNGIEIRHGVGIDVGEVRAVRAGIRNNNDLIWIGKAASFSAKLSDIRRVGYHSHISKRTYNKLNEGAKYDSDGNNMWVSDSFSFAGKTETIYRSNNWKRP